MMKSPINTVQGGSKKQSGGDLLTSAAGTISKCADWALPSLYWRPDNVTNLIAEMPHPSPDKARKALAKLANSLSPVA
jgi:hypothetical protein